MADAYAQCINTFNENEGIKKKKKKGDIGVDNETHFIKIIKVHKSKSIPDSPELDESAMYAMRPKGVGNSMTFIDVPVNEPEVTSDLSNYCQVLSKFKDKKLDMKSLDCLFRNLNSVALSEAKDFLFCSYKGIKGDIGNCEMKIQVHVSPTAIGF